MERLEESFTFSTPNRLTPAQYFYADDLFQNGKIRPLHSSPPLLSLLTHELPNLERAHHSLEGRLDKWGTFSQGIQDGPSKPSFLDHAPAQYDLHYSLNTTYIPSKPTFFDPLPQDDDLLRNSDHPFVIPSPTLHFTHHNSHGLLYLLHDYSSPSYSSTSVCNESSLSAHYRPNQAAIFPYNQCSHITGHPMSSCAPDEAPLAQHDFVKHMQHMIESPRRKEYITTHHFCKQGIGHKFSSNDTSPTSQCYYKVTHTSTPNYTYSNVEYLPDGQPHHMRRKASLLAFIKRQLLSASSYMLKLFPRVKNMGVISRSSKTKGKKELSVMRYDEEESSILRQGDAYKDNPSSFNASLNVSLGKRNLTKVQSIASPHEHHYLRQRAYSQNMKRKTYLPYQKALLSCIIF